MNEIPDYAAMAILLNDRTTKTSGVPRRVEDDAVLKRCAELFGVITKTKKT